MIEKLHAVLAGDDPIFFLLAGPNGAGKSTFRRTYLDPVGIRCIDPDEVARLKFGTPTKEQSREASIAAAELVTEALVSGESIGLETVFSDRQGLKLSLVTDAQSLGHVAGLIYIGLDSPELSIARVMDRVEHGGHDVPDELIRARYARSLENLRAGMLVADWTLLIDNSTEIQHRIFALARKDGCIEYFGAPPRWYDMFTSNGAVN
jgi:predicted ABC-type ATPase